MASPINAQNDCLYVSVTTLKSNVDNNCLLWTHLIFSHSMMVYVAVSKLGCTELFFVESRVKITCEYYRNVLLMEQMLPAIRRMSSDFFIFQQDSALAHRSKDTIALLRCETSSFIGPKLSPANSQDLNPADYSIWGLIYSLIYSLIYRNASTRQQYGASTS